MYVSCMLELLFTFYLWSLKSYYSIRFLNLESGESFLFFNNFELFWKILVLVPVTLHLVHSIFPSSLQCCQSRSVDLSDPCKEDTRAISLCVPELPHLSLLFLSRCKLTPKYGLLHCFPQSRDQYQVVVQSQAMQWDKPSR